MRHLPMWTADIESVKQYFAPKSTGILAYSHDQKGPQN
jgi:hypothetical protein